MRIGGIANEKAGPVGRGPAFRVSGMRLRYLSSSISRSAVYTLSLVSDTACMR